MHPQRALNEEGYLALERAAEFKSEFYDGRMVAMAGAREPHNLVAFNASVAIGRRLTGSCRGYTSDMKVRVPAGFNFYPDVSVACAEPQFHDSGNDILLNPILIVEVLSPSTEAVDRGRKFELYRTIPSLRAYLLIAQDRVQVDLYLRQDDNRWVLTSVSALDDTLDLTNPIGCQFPLSELYRNVTLPAQKTCCPRRLELELDGEGAIGCDERERMLVRL